MSYSAYCEYEGCQRKSAYGLEWWGLNQHGEDPRVVAERYSCPIPEHLVRLAHHDDFGGYPDEINDADTGEVKSRLLDLVCKALDGEVDKETIDSLVSIADPPVGQLQLFSPPSL